MNTAVRSMTMEKKWTKTKLGQICSLIDQWANILAKRWRGKGSSLCKLVWVCVSVGICLVNLNSQTHTESKSKSTRKKLRGLQLIHDIKDIGLYKCDCLTQDQSSHDSYELNAKRFIVQDDYDDGKIERDGESKKREWRKRKIATRRHSGRSK